MTNHHQCSTREIPRLLRFCVVSWKGSSTSSEYVDLCVLETDDLFITKNIVWEDKLTWFKSSSQYRTLDRIDGEPMESSGTYSQDSPRSSLSRNPKVHEQNGRTNEAWKKRIEWITTSQSYRDYDGFSGEPTEFKWNIFPGFDTLQLYGKVKDLLSRLGETPETFTGRILFMSMFNDISCGTKDNERECLANAKIVSIFAKKFGIGQWSFIGPGSEKEWYSMEENSPQGIWDKIAERMLVEFAESGCPIFRATTPLSRCKL